MSLNFKVEDFVRSCDEDFLPRNWFNENITPSAFLVRHSYALEANLNDPSQHSSKRIKSPYQMLRRFSACADPNEGLLNFHIDDVNEAYDQIDKFTDINKQQPLSSTSIIRSKSAPSIGNFFSAVQGSSQTNLIGSLHMENITEVKTCPKMKISCSNCNTTTTSQWRSSELDRSIVLCNACGLYEKTYKVTRPESLRSNTIKRRSRVRRKIAAK
eukprot:Awhi_evm1s9633